MSIALYGQFGNTTTRQGSGAPPAGPNQCSALQLYNDVSNGIEYYCDARTGTWTQLLSGSSAITGSGTTNRLAVFTGLNSIGNSGCSTDNGSTLILCPGTDSSTGITFQNDAKNQTTLAIDTTSNNQVLFNPGGSAHPGIAFSGFPSTGIYQVTSNIRTTIAGTDIFTVQNGGILLANAKWFLDFGTGGLDTYRNVSTAGWGAPAIYGSGRTVGATAAVSSVAAYTVGGADGSFEISANVNVTAATTNNFTVTVTYTDETNSSRTLTLGFTQLAGATLLSNITNVTGTGPYESPVYHIRCKASTTITIATTGTFTSVTYNVEGTITQIA